MRLLDHPILVRFTREDAGGLQFVMIEQTLITPGERTTATHRQFMRRGRQSATLPPRRPAATALPAPRVAALHSFRSTPPSATEAQHQLEEQMLERCATDCHTEFVAIGEVVGRFASGRMFLRKEHFLVRPLQRPPLADPAL